MLIKTKRIKMAKRLNSNTSRWTKASRRLTLTISMSGRKRLSRKLMFLTNLASSTSQENCSLKIDYGVFIFESTSKQKVSRKEQLMKKKK